MKRFLLSGIAVFGLTVLPNASLAADVQSYTDWTGFYLGAGAGVKSLSSELSMDALASAQEYTDLTASQCEGVEINSGLGCRFFDASGNNASSDSKWGFFGIAEAGFDYQIGSSLLVGILGSVDFGSTVSNSATASGVWEFGAYDDRLGLGNDVIDSGNVHLRAEVERGTTWAAGARVGALVTDATLLYALAGYTQADMTLKGQAQLEGLTSDIYSISESEWLDGFFVGAGFEHLLAEHFSVKAEYRFADYGSMSVSDRDTLSVQGVSGDAEGSVHADDLKEHSIRVLFAYRF